eukprot:8319344-Lingulodinium_polyedra.AAC.1
MYVRRRAAPASLRVSRAMHLIRRPPGGHAPGSRAQALGTGPVCCRGPPREGRGAEVFESHA